VRGGHVAREKRTSSPERSVSLCNDADLGGLGLRAQDRAERFIYEKQPVRTPSRLIVKEKGKDRKEKREVSIH